MLLKAVLQSSASVFEGVEAVVREPPYITCLIADLSSSEHDQIELQDISHILEVLSTAQGFCKTRKCGIE